MTICSEGLSATSADAMCEHWFACTRVCSKSMSGSLAGVLRACAGLLARRMRSMRQCSSTRDRLACATSALRMSQPCSAPSVLMLDSMELPSGAMWNGGCQHTSHSGMLLES